MEFFEKEREYGEDTYSRRLGSDVRGEVWRREYNRYPTDRERRPYRPYWKKYRRVARTDRSLKAIRNERSRWRTIGRILIALGLNVPENICRSDIESLATTTFTLEQRRSGLDTETYKKIVASDSMSDAYLRSFIDIARMEGYSRLYVTSLVGSIVRTNRKLDYSIFIKMLRNKDIATDANPRETTVEEQRDVSASSTDDIVRTRETRDSKTSLLDRRRVSLKSDGVLTFSPREFIRLFRRVTNDIRAIRENDSRLKRERDFEKCSLVDREVEGEKTVDESEKQRRLFLYTFFTLAVTGQRLSDVAQLGIKELRRLRYNGVCVVRCCKTKNLMRIEIPEVLHGKKSTVSDRIIASSDRDSSVVDRSKDKPAEEEIMDFRDPRTEIIDDLDTADILSVFETWYENGTLSIPFSRLRARVWLDRSLNRIFEESFDRAKPRGLSFHALRRAFAGYKFLQGCPLDIIQKNMDHASRKMTNHYINKCLYDFTNDDTI